MKINELVKDLSKDLQDITQDIMQISGILLKDIDLKETTQSQIRLSLIKPLVKLNVDSIHIVDKSGKVKLGFPQNGLYSINIKNLLKHGEIFNSPVVAKKIFKNEGLSNFILRKLQCSDEYIVVAINSKTKPYRVKLIHTVIAILDEKIELAKLTSKSNAFSLLRLLIEILYRFDKETYMHSFRVRKYAVQLAKILNTPEDKIKDIALSAMLHDIGKLFLPFDVLKKNDKLSKEEFEAIKMHVIKGHEILRALGFKEEILDAVLHHHEKIDGSGYPDGTTKLSDTTAIIAMADILDAVQSARTYKNKTGYKKLIAEIRQFEGKLPQNIINAAEKLITSDTFWIIKKLSSKKEKSIKYAQTGNDIFGQLVQLKNENKGLEHQIKVYKKIIEATQKNYEKLLFELKGKVVSDGKEKKSKLNTIYEFIKDSEKIEGIAVIENGSIKELVGKIPLEALNKIILEGSRSLRTENGLIYRIVLDESEICVLFKKEAKKLSKSSELLIKSLLR
ncbi:HD-GYP domain-containing protein [Hippea maritima]|uniref:Metal dependent phosphohydrolase n=1 Tax=Hippea maritima (strain ATCC 700847 / DSM 10411 / MH2) TaxID=760142 RepID=F2LUC6_HIPMA|nr:HD domain-containing phosphohydrolase [Hippea maritima]AEA33452.1 metal dependent phosphohydrolase [Hippea maritima DSM 10411]